MNEQNHWITFAGHHVVGWVAVLPPPDGDAERLIRFGIGLATAGRRHEVWDPQRLPGVRPYISAEQSFEDYLRQSTRERGRVPISPLYKTPGDQLWAPGKLAFYEGGSIVEDTIGDVGELLRRLRPGRYRSVTRSVSPVLVFGMAPEISDTVEVAINIELETDIWFPRVMGMPELDPSVDQEIPESFINQELAERHTPRFNAFLREVRDLTLSLGGSWEKADTDGYAVNYVDLWDESGILL